MCTMIMAIQAMCKNWDEVLDIVQSLIPNISSLHKQQTGHFSQMDYMLYTVDWQGQWDSNRSGTLLVLNGRAVLDSGSLCENRTIPASAAAELETAAT
jgi:hypothetical protein